MLPTQAPSWADTELLRHPGERSPVPEYAPLLEAFHRAFHKELLRCVDDLPLGPGARVLDVPCGDGFYAHWFAQRLAPGGLVVGADRSASYVARGRPWRERGRGSQVSGFVAADVYRLPFADDGFDLVWCAHSLISLTDPVE